MTLLRPDSPSVRPQRMRKATERAEYDYNFFMLFTENMTSSWIRARLEGNQPSTSATTEQGRGQPNTRPLTEWVPSFSQGVNYMMKYFAPTQKMSITAARRDLIAIGFPYVRAQNWVPGGYIAAISESHGDGYAKRCFGNSTICVLSTQRLPAVRHGKISRAWLASRVKCGQYSRE